MRRKKAPDLGVKAAKVQRALETCWNDHSGADSLPKQYTGTTEYADYEAIGIDVFDRLQPWLNHMTDAREPIAYGALLQMWLLHYGFGWPPGVFVNDCLVQRGASRGTTWEIGRRIAAEIGAGPRPTRAS